MLANDLLIVDEDETIRDAMAVVFTLAVMTRSQPLKQ